MVLGAGLGTRLKPFTDRFPKPLMPVLGIPCIEFALLNLRNAGVDEVIVNTHAHREQMRQYLNSDPVSNLRLTESNETEQLLGSAGGFRKALPHFQNQAFFSMNADVIHFPDLQALALAHEKARAEHKVVMTLLLASGRALESQSGEYREIITDPVSKLIVDFGEKKARVPFYTGTAIFETEAFAALSDSSPHEFVPEILEPWIAEGKVAFAESSALWLDIGSPELWAEAQTKLALAQQKNQIPEWAKKRLEQADPTLGGRFKQTRNHIQWEGIQHEIKNLRNP